MFNENHIDASPRKGKMAGAYSSTHDYFKASFILMSYNQTISDVLTLAHEMGHSVHGYLSINEQKYLNNQYSPCIAETASEFGRFMVVDNLKENTDNEMVKKFILFNHLEELAGSIFEVGSRFFFEKSLYEAIDTGEYLDPEKVCKLFDKPRRQFFGDAIEFLPEQSYDWTWKPHYYIAQLRYYNYPYVFGELLVMALYNKYKKERKPFVSKFKAFLSSGGSKSPLDLGKEMGVDLETKDFWQMGFDEFKTILEETKKLF
jgi:oligoendopeptidase F